MSSKIYTLGYTGPEVDDAIAKIQNLDVTSISGGIIELESTEATPYNLDFLRSVGLYKAAYVYDATAPSGVAGITPVYIYVSKVNDGSEYGELIQSLNAGGVTYTRTSTDNGQTWDVWETGDGLNAATEITPEEVDQIFADIFGDTGGVDNVALFNMLSATSNVVSRTSTTVSSSLAKSAPVKNIAF